MNLFFWNKTPRRDVSMAKSFGDHKILVERELLSSSDFEKRFGIIYLPQLDFPSWSDFVSISQKVERFRRKKYLDQQQLWLGAYFRKELESPSVPLVRLRLIDDVVGWGVFAEQDLTPMTYIGEYAGCVRRKKRADTKNPYCFQYNIVNGEPTKYTIDAREQGGLVRFINHSYEPNLMSALATHQNLSHVVLFVSRLIRKGEQLFYDYGPDYWKKRSKPQCLK